LDGIGEHGDHGLTQASPIQVFLADQVIAAGDLHLVVVIGEINEETQVSQHRLRDSARDRLAEPIGTGFRGQRQQRVEGLRVGAVTTAFLSR
jgi:hypothetical protein